VGGRKELKKERDIEYIFTFGIGHEHEGKFIAIPIDDYYEARAIMNRHFKDKWAFQYPNRGMAGVERFGLTELELPKSDAKLPRRQSVLGRK